MPYTAVNVLNKTTERLVLAQNKVITACSSSSECSSFILISKWGCDGSSGHSTYKQKFTNADDHLCLCNYATKVVI